MTVTAEPSRYRVAGMDCASCAQKIDTAVRRLPGVEDVKVSVTAGTMTVWRRAAAGPAGEVKAAVERLGYGVAPAADRAAGGHSHDHGPGPHGHDHAGGDGPLWTSAKFALTLACGLALGVAWGLGRVWPATQPWVFVAAMLVGLVPIARRAWAGARAGTPFSIETLMTLAAAGAVAIGAGEEAATVVLLFLIGEMLEGVAAGRARASIEGLSALVPKTALVERGGSVETVAAERLAVGAIILVRPGDRIAADGEIVEGAGAVDEAPVTGESAPKRKSAGDRVFAGTINAEGVLRVRVEAAAADNTIARVVRLVEEAQERKAPTERFIDRFSTYYTPGVVAVAALVALVPPLLSGQDWGGWLYKGLAILLIGCPCALVISTPAAIAAALAAGARRGLLIKGGAALEALSRVDAIALDKTGTLTQGRPTVTDIVAADLGERRALSLAAALETGSNHPLALAILERAKAEGAPVPPAAGVADSPGEGVSGRVGGVAAFLGSPAAAGARAEIGGDLQARIEAFAGQGKSVAALVADGRVAAVFALRDEPRADAREGVAALKAAGIEPVMLTGDNARAAEAVGASLGLPVRAQLLPQDKLRIVRELQAAGRRVAKVGDGVNDAPALAGADVGIAMGGGTDVALETADAAVLHGRVMDLADMVDLSRRTMANIRQNVAAALGLKVVFLVTTIAGITGLWPAILADTGATVLVTANAMRLMAWNGRG